MKRAFLLGTMLAAIASPAFATAIYTLDQSDSPNVSGSGPYAQITVDRQTSTTAHISVIGLNGFAFGDVGVNVASTNFSVSNLTFTDNPNSNPNQNASYTQCTFCSGGSGMLDGFGNFELIQNDQPNGFASSVIALSFDLTNAGGSWIDSAHVLDTNTHVPPEFAAVHSFTTDGREFFSASATTPVCSATDCTPTQQTSMPEPMSIAVLGIGLIGLGVARRRRSK